jgi:hypothetical protein
MTSKDQANRPKRGLPDPCPTCARHQRADQLGAR